MSYINQILVMYVHVYLWPIYAPVMLIQMTVNLYEGLDGGGGGGPEFGIQ